MVRAGCVFVAGIHPSRTWTSGSFESVRWNACVHRLDLGLYSHPKEFWGNGVWTHVNSKGKIPSTGKCPQRRIEPATLWQRAQALPTELFRPPERAINGCWNGKSWNRKSTVFQRPVLSKACTIFWYTGDSKAMAIWRFLTITRHFLSPLFLFCISNGSVSNTDCQTAINWQPSTTQAATFRLQIVWTRYK